MSLAGKETLTSHVPSCVQLTEETMLIPTGDFPPHLLFHPRCPLPLPLSLRVEAAFMENMLLGGNWCSTVILEGALPEVALASVPGPQVCQLTQDCFQYPPRQSCHPSGKAGGTPAAVLCNSLRLPDPDDMFSSKDVETSEI